MSFFFFKQKTAYEMRISDWSSDVCSSDLLARLRPVQRQRRRDLDAGAVEGEAGRPHHHVARTFGGSEVEQRLGVAAVAQHDHRHAAAGSAVAAGEPPDPVDRRRSEEHTSELQSLMRSSYAGFCLKKKTKS